MSVVGRVLEIWRYPVKSMSGERLGRCALGARGIPGDRGWALRDEAAGEMRGAKKLPALMRCAAAYDAEPTAERIPPATMTLPDGARVRTTDADANARLSALLGRAVTLWPLQPADHLDHYRHGRPDHDDLETELRSIFGRLPDEPLPDLSLVPPELYEFVSPLGTYFDLAPLALLTTASLRALQRFNPTARFERCRFRPNLLIEPSDGAEGLIESDWTGKRLRLGHTVVRIVMPTMRCSMVAQAVDDLPKDPSVLRTIVRDANQNLGVYAEVEETGPVAVGDAVELL
jgi:hypothetical protein